MKTWATSITPEERAANVTKGNKSRAKPIHEYDINGLFIKTWACYADVIANGSNKGKLSSALKDQRVECSGSLWSHKLVENLGVTPEDIATRSAWSTKPKNAKAIYQDGHIMWPFQQQSGNMEVTTVSMKRQSIQENHSSGAFGLANALVARTGGCERTQLPWRCHVPSGSSPGTTDTVASQNLRFHVSALAALEHELRTACTCGSHLLT